MDYEVEILIMTVNSGKLLKNYRRVSQSLALSSADFKVYRQGQTLAGIHKLIILHFIRETLRLTTL